MSVAFLDAVPPGASFGVGSLPYRDMWVAAEYSLTAFDILTLPSLPKRSPAEATVAQALVGSPGVTLGQYGALAVDVSRLDPTGDIDTDVRRENFAGFRSCLDVAAARGYDGPVKWQFVGPISIGITLRRAGASTEAAFAMGRCIARSHILALWHEVRRALPNSPQLVVIDEPFLEELMAPKFPLAPDEAIDLLSSAMAVLEDKAAIGVHACGCIDIASLIEAGPSVLSLPVDAHLVDVAGYLNRFLEGGGVIAWGAVLTEGPIGATVARSRRGLDEMFEALADRGCDPAALRRQSLITPQCGLGAHSVEVAERVVETVRRVSRLSYTRS